MRRLFWHVLMLWCLCVAHQEDIDTKLASIKTSIADSNMVWFGTRRGEILFTEAGRPRKLRLNRTLRRT